MFAPRVFLAFVRAQPAVYHRVARTFSLFDWEIAVGTFLCVRLEPQTRGLVGVLHRVEQLQCVFLAGGALMPRGVMNET